MKLNPRSFACVVPVLLALGCGSSGPSANDAGGAAGGGSGGSSAGATGAAGHGGAGAAGGGSAAGAGGGGGSAGGAAGTGSGGSGATDGGSDGPAPPLDGPRADSRDGQSAADGASCGTLANTSTPVAPTLVASVSRNAIGGALTDGIYELVDAEETLSSAPAKFWRTFRIGNGGTTFEWTIQDIGLPPEHHFGGALSIMGTSLLMNDQCAGVTLSYPYDAQGVGLTLYFLFGGAPSGRVFHYRVRAPL